MNHGTDFVLHTIMHTVHSFAGVGIYHIFHIQVALVLIHRKAVFNVHP